MRPDVAAFHDAATGTWSYVIADPATRVAALLDPVLDFDAKSARRAAMERARAELDGGNPELRTLLDFVESSPRGVGF